MNTVILVATLLATPPTVQPAAPAVPPTAVTTPRAHPGQRAVPPLKWERIIKRCGAPCLIWARHVLDAATSPHGFAYQIKRLARAARLAHRLGRLRPRQARQLKFAIGRLTRALKRMTADGLLTHRERLRLLKGVIKTGALLHRATRRGVARRPWRRPIRPAVVPRPPAPTPPPPPPAPHSPQRRPHAAYIF